MQYHRQSLLLTSKPIDRSCRHCSNRPDQQHIAHKCDVLFGFVFAIWESFLDFAIEAIISRRQRRYQTDFGMGRTACISDGVQQGARELCNFTLSKVFNIFTI